MLSIALLGIAVAIVAEGTLEHPRRRREATHPVVGQHHRPRPRQPVQVAAHHLRPRRSSSSSPCSASTSSATSCAPAPTSGRVVCDRHDASARRPRRDGRLAAEVTDLKTHFQTDRGIVRCRRRRHASTLDRGKTLGVVGESGSGKTVLSRSIMGLLPKRGTIREGSVDFDGTEIIGLSDKEMRDYWGAQMSMIFQDPMTSLNPVMKIGKQITESIRQHLDVDEGLRAASSPRTCSRSVRIPEPKLRLKEYPHQLSGGMRQRVCIAVALALRSEAPVRRRAHDRARRDGAGAGARPHGPAAARALHGDGAHHPRPRGGRRTGRRDRGDVRGPDRREGEDECAVLAT